MDSKTFGMISPENKLEPLDETVNLKDLYKDINMDDLYTSFNDIVYNINTIIYETENIMSMSEKNLVLKIFQYNKLLNFYFKKNIKNTIFFLTIIFFIFYNI